MLALEQNNDSFTGSTASGCVFLGGYHCRCCGQPQKVQGTTPPAAILYSLYVHVIISQLKSWEILSVLKGLSQSVANRGGFQCVLGWEPKFSPL